MDSSYLAASLKRFEDTIDILKTNYEEIKNNLDAEKEKHQELNGRYEEIKNNLDEEKEKYQELNGKYEEIKKRLKLQEKITPINV